MSAETLRRAAAKMRERVEAAGPGPWEMYADRTVRAPDRTIIWDDSCQEKERGLADGEHVSSWHPVVAFAVADWLDDEADNLLPDTINDQIRLGMTPEDAAAMAAVLHRPALAVARAYLGEQS